MDDKENSEIPAPLEAAHAAKQLITTESNPRKKQKIVPFDVDKTEMNAIIAEVFPNRRHLGTIIYNPTTTWELLQVEQLHGLESHEKEILLDCKHQFIARLQERNSEDEVEYMPLIPPLSNANINCLLEIKIPYKFIKEYQELCNIGKAQKKRELWGGAGGLYTDDSDILSVLHHLGLFDDNLDLTDVKADWKKEDVIKPAIRHQDEDGVELLDLSVTVLLLPTLKQYHGFYKNGINSRSWLGRDVHDGLTFGVYDVKYQAFALYTGERGIQKRAQQEFIEDRCSQQENIKQGYGWHFDSKCYQELREKFSKEDSDKK